MKFSDEINGERQGSGYQPGSKWGKSHRVIHASWGDRMLEKRRMLGKKMDYKTDSLIQTL